MQRPLVLMILAFMLGIIGASILKVHMLVALGAAVFTCIIAGIGIIRTWRFNIWVLFCTCVCLGMVLTIMKLSAVASPLVDLKGTNIQVTGVVIDQPDHRPEASFYKLKVQQAMHDGKVKKTSGVLRVKVLENTKRYKYGDILKLMGFVVVPEPPGNPRAFDYRTWLTRQGIAANMIVKKSEDIKVLGRGGGNIIFRAAFAFRNDLESIYDKTMSKEKAAILKGLLFGTRGEIPQDVQLAFNQTGLVHLTQVVE